MKARSTIFLVLVVSYTAFAGCSSRKKEARERARLELEEQSLREAQTANKAITGMNQRMFDKKPLGTPAAASAGEQAKPGDQPQPQKKN
jgi:hypothetical protein